MRFENANIFGGGTKFIVSNDLKDTNATGVITFKENHKRCLLIFSTGNNAGNSNMETEISTTVTDFKKIYGRYKYFNNWLSGGLAIIELNNVVANDTVTLEKGSSQFITNICILDL